MAQEPEDLKDIFYRTSFISRTEEARHQKIAHPDEDFSVYCSDIPRENLAFYNGQYLYGADLHDAFVNNSPDRSPYGYSILEDMDLRKSDLLGATIRSQLRNADLRDCKARNVDFRYSGFYGKTKISGAYLHSSKMNLRGFFRAAGWEESFGNSETSFWLRQKNSAIFVQVEGIAYPGRQWGKMSNIKIMPPEGEVNPHKAGRKNAFSEACEAAAHDKKAKVHIVALSDAMLDDLLLPSHLRKQVEKMKLEISQP